MHQGKQVLREGRGEAGPFRSEREADEVGRRGGERERRALGGSGRGEAVDETMAVAGDGGRGGGEDAVGGGGPEDVALVELEVVSWEGDRTVVGLAEKALAAEGGGDGLAQRGGRLRISEGIVVVVVSHGDRVGLPVRGASYNEPYGMAFVTLCRSGGAAEARHS